MPVSSRFPVLDLPEVDIYSFLFHRQNRPYPANNIIYQDADDSTRKYTYTDAATLSLQFGQALQSQYSIHKGDVIALFTPNDVDYPIVTMIRINVPLISLCSLLAFQYNAVR